MRKTGFLHYKILTNLSLFPQHELYKSNIFLLKKKNVSDAQNFKCPPKDGQYEDQRQCDKYYDCNDGVPTEKLCPDGLVFDPLIRKQNKCDQPFNVDCGDRTELRKYFFKVARFQLYKTFCIMGAVFNYYGMLFRASKTERCVPKTEWFLCPRRPLCM